MSQTDPSRWTGRHDEAEGPAGRRWHQIIAPLDSQTSGVAIAGFACDAGVARNLGRVGARGGPAAIRAMLANMPVRACTSLIDAGDVTCLDDQSLEAAQGALSTLTADLLARGLFPLILGGGHEIAFGSWGGLAAHVAGKDVPRIGILNLDAHFDLRMAERASSGTPFRQIAEECAARGWPFRYCCLGISDFANTQALFDRARALGVTWLRDEEMPLHRLGDVLAVADTLIAEVEHLYLTVCLDVLPAGMAPGVSAPSARGVEVGVIEAIIDRVTASGKLRLADLAEMNPLLDIDNRTARVAARLAARIAEGVSRAG